jgi:hypothetical protein
VWIECGGRIGNFKRQRLEAKVLCRDVCGADLSRSLTFWDGNMQIRTAESKALEPRASAAPNAQRD